MFRVDKKKSILNQDQQIIKEKLCLLDSITTGNLIHIQSQLSKYDYPLKSLVDPDTYQNAFFYACYIKDPNDALKIFKFLLSQEVNPLHKDSIDQSCFFYACREGKVTLMDFLINQCGSDINEIDFFGQNPIFYAAREGKVDAVKYLIEHGSEINIQDNQGQTCLFFAVKEKHFEVVKILLKAKCDIHICDNQGINVVTLSERIREKKITEFLIENGGKKQNLRELPNKLLLNKKTKKKKEDDEVEQKGKFVFCKKNDKGIPGLLTSGEILELLLKYPELEKMITEK